MGRARRAKPCSASRFRINSRRPRSESFPSGSCRLVGVNDVVRSEVAVFSPTTKTCPFTQVVAAKKSVPRTQLPAPFVTHLRVRTLIEHLRYQNLALIWRVEQVCAGLR